MLVGLFRIAKIHYFCQPPKKKAIFFITTAIERGNQPFSVYASPTSRQAATIQRKPNLTLSR